MMEEQFIQRHVEFCNAKLGENGGLTKRRNCGKKLYASILKFGLDPRNIDSTDELMAATVEERAELARQRNAE